MFEIEVDNQRIKLLELTIIFALHNAQHRAIKEQKDVILYGDNKRLGTFTDSGEFYPSTWFDENPEYFNRS